MAATPAGGVREGRGRAIGDAGIAPGHPPIAGPGGGVADLAGAAGGVNARGTTGGVDAAGRLDAAGRAGAAACGDLSGALAATRSSGGCGE